MGVEGVEDVVEGVDSGVVGAVGGECGLDYGSQFLYGLLLGYDEFVLFKGYCAVVGGGVVCEEGCYLSEDIYC